MLYIVCPKVNSFALRADNNGEEENVGTALYRANSIFDHSCAPNATTIFSGDVKIIACTCIYYKLMFRQEAVHKVGGVQSEDGAEQLLHLLPGPVHDQVILVLGYHNQQVVWRAKILLLSKHRL